MFKRNGTVSLRLERNIIFPTLYLIMSDIMTYIVRKNEGVGAAGCYDSSHAIASHSYKWVLCMDCFAQSTFINR